MNKLNTLSFFYLSLIATIGVGYYMQSQGAPLVMEHTPYGIFNLEFAWNRYDVIGIKKLWDNEGLAIAITNIYIDFIFLLVYSTSLYFGLKLASERVYHKQFFNKLIGFLLSIWFMPGLLDACENVLMLQNIWYNPTHIVAYTTTTFAGLKFLLIFIFIASFVVLKFAKQR
jgi:hypothetical protein